MSAPVYLDGNADAPVLPAAWQAYCEGTRVFGNPSSSHAAGRLAKEHLEGCRTAIAEQLGAQPVDVVFTSGGTEANALAIYGQLSQQSGAHVVCSTIEHPAVEQALTQLCDAGVVELTRVSPGRSGRLAPAAVEAALRPQTRLVCVTLANNETGVVQPVAEIAALCSRRGVRLHTDAVQAAGRMSLDFRSLAVDTLALSGHKLGAVAGVGALLVGPGLELSPIFAGGGQEASRRAGTENLAGIASLAAALCRWDEGERLRTAQLRDRLEQELCASAAPVEILGAESPRLGNTSCVRFFDCEGDGLMMALDLEGICVSTGSACSSGSVDPSPTLLGMGLTAREARQTVRFSLPWNAKEADVLRAAAATAALVRRMRALTET